ncbi:MAG: galactose mutarotase [Pseudomonadota bacterium]|nr:galactose mutarotase [Pseudomonadota bacterium]
MTAKVFGRIGDTPVLEAEIGSKAGARAKILTYGAVLRDLLIPVGGGLQRVTLGLNSVEDYVEHSPSFGAVPGRFANRIAHGRFAIDGVAYTLDRKAGAEHTLHGGSKGFGRRIWKLGEHSAEAVELSLVSDDGDMGFPGQMRATCRYSFVEPATLRVELKATSDKPTLVNLTQHAYFNLDGSPDILDHQLELGCDFYTPSDALLIPTGEIRAVAGTGYDFRAARPIRNPQGVTYDTNFVVSRALGADGLAFVARLKSPRNGLALELHSSEPGVQVYDAATLNCPVPGLDGARYGAHAGLCLEPQAFPDSPNRRHFTDTVLRPDQEYSHVSEFRFLA